MLDAVENVLTKMLYMYWGFSGTLLGYFFIYFWAFTVFAIFLFFLYRVTMTFAYNLVG